MALGLADVITGGSRHRRHPHEAGQHDRRGQARPDPVAGADRGGGDDRVRAGAALHPVRSLHVRDRLQRRGRRRAGINVNLHLIKVYAIAGLLSGLGGVLSLAYFTTTTISGHTTDNLTAISAVVIGGTSLFGAAARCSGRSSACSSRSCSPAAW